jgi:hypothetical protein
MNRPVQWQPLAVPIRSRSGTLLVPYAQPRTGQQQVPRAFPFPTAQEQQAQQTQQEDHLIDRLRTGLSAVTPTLLFTAIGTGFALSIGAGLGAAFMRYLLPEKRGRRAA